METDPGEPLEQLNSRVLGLCAVLISGTLHFGSILGVNKNMFFWPTYPGSEGFFELWAGSGRTEHRLSPCHRARLGPFEDFLRQRWTWFKRNKTGSL